MGLDVAALFVDQHERLQAYFRRRIGRRDPSLADDLAGDVFLRAWERRDRYRELPGVPPRAWLMTIARHTLIDYVRAERPATSLDVRSAVGLDPIVPDSTDATVQALDLADAVAQLPPRQRAVIVRMFYGGELQRELRDISTLYGVKEIRKGAVKNLRKALGLAENPGLVF